MIALPVPLRTAFRPDNSLAQDESAPDNKRGGEYSKLKMQNSALAQTY
jgi:hypothetical protein